MDESESTERYEYYDIFLRNNLGRGLLTFSPSAMHNYEVHS
jgi:hypothetical protein